jgi:hypothetical protein
MADRASSLGIIFSRRIHAASISPVDWASRRKDVDETRGKISRMHCLSVFARAFASEISRDVASNILEPLIRHLSRKSGYCLKLPL